MKGQPTDVVSCLVRGGEVWWAVWEGVRGKPSGERESLSKGGLHMRRGLIVSKGAVGDVDGVITCTF